MNTETENSKHEPGDKTWFEKNVNLIIVGLVVACVLTVVAQLVLPMMGYPMFDDHHPAHFPGIEDVIGFQAFFGFASFVAVVFLGKFLRLIIMRKEDYYDS